MYAKKTLSRIIGLLQITIFALLLSFLLPQSIIANQNVGLGKIGFREAREISDGVLYENYTAYNKSGEQRAFSVTIGQGKLAPLATYGPNVNGGNVLSKIVNLAESQGHKVVAAINGDFYDTSNGIPSGAMIVDGRFVTSGNNRTSIGFKADGSAVHGVISFSTSYNDGSKNVTINHVNKGRKANESSVYLYTEDFGPSTKTDRAGREVVLEVDGELKVGGTLDAKVIQVNENATDTPIGKNQIVIGVHNNSKDKISNLTVGKEIKISVKNNNKEDWENVVQSLGAGAVLVKDGKITNDATSNTDVHPRSAIGFKADGTYMIFQVDGRQPGYSNGLSYREMFEFFTEEHDIVDAYNLDGGGSSQIMVRLPGDDKATTQNKPSDGGERSNSNALLFVATEEADPAKKLAHLHAYPRNIIILENGSLKLNVKATDKNFYPVATPNNITYTVNNNIGSIDENGRFVAKSGSGTGTITIKSGDITETVEVRVVDSIDKMTSNRTFISVAPEGSVQLDVNAYKDHMPISAGNTAFTWELSTPKLGTITKEGIFTGGSDSATGTINIKYKSFELKVPVEVGRAPVMLQTFESDTIGGKIRQVIENPGNKGLGSISINEDERYVKFGHKSLRVDYDFRNATGTYGVSANINSGAMLSLDGYPTHLGVWVYGDGNGANIRMMVYDGNNGVQYLSYSPDVVDWVGWKYIEAPVPAGLKTPIKIQYPIRVMTVGGNVKTHGTLYFDNLRAVYGFKNDDVLSPKHGEPTPAQGSVVKNKQQTISLRMWDDDSGIHTGINKDSIQLWLNGKEIKNVLLTDNEDLSVTLNYTPGHLDPYRPGPQYVKVRFEDNYGNITFKEWDFVVDGDYVLTEGRVDTDADVIYRGEQFKYTISSNHYKNFAKLSGKLHYNHNALEIVSAKVVDSNITFNKNKNDANKGLYEFEISGMDELANKTNPDLIEITFAPIETFRAGADTAIVFSDVAVYETGFEDPRMVQLPRFEKIVDYRYRVSYPTSTVGREMQFKITDDELKPVRGAFLEIVGQDITVQAISDRNGIIVTDAFVDLPVNTKFKVRAIFEGLESSLIEVEILPSLRKPDPDFIAVTPNEDVSTGVVITWQTDVNTTDGEVQYRKKGDSDWITNSTQETEYIRLRNAKVQTQEYLAHRVRLTGLSADTEYEYRVGTEGYYSDVKTFKTAKEDGELNILYFADPQSANTAGYNRTKKVIEEAFKYNPNFDFGLIGGDLVEDVNIQSNWNALNDVLGSYFESMIFATATGNHDMIGYYGDPFNWMMSGPDNGIDGTYGVNYFFEYGDVAVGVIDTESPATFDEQQAWFIDKMNNSTKPFKIALMHRSVYPTFNNDLHVRPWYETFDKTNIDLVLSGHDHVYNRTAMRNNQKTEVGFGPVYVSGGSAGPKFYNASDLENRPWVDVVYEENNNIFMSINIKDNVLTFESYALVGDGIELIDSFSYDKSDIILPERIEVVYPETIYLGDEIQLSATIYDTNGNVIDEDVEWSLVKNVSRVSLSKDGKLTISEAAKGGAEVQVKATFMGVEKVITFELIEPVNIHEIIQAIIQKRKDRINAIIR